MNHRRLLLRLLFSSSTSSALAYNPINSNSNMKQAWTCHGQSQRQLVQHLQQAGIISSPEVATVMTRVDRAMFTTAPYQDAPQPIGHGQTISAPHMHAHALELILPRLKQQQQQQQQEKTNSVAILDVGCGSGYLTACFVELLQLLKINDFMVYGIDVWPSLIQSSIQNIQNYRPELLSKMSLSLGDGWKGIPGHTWDAIHVGAAASELPQPLMMQLKVGGIMIVPVGPLGGAQILYRVERLYDTGSVFRPSDFSIQPLLGVHYVPLIHPEKE